MNQNVKIGSLATTLRTTTKTLRYYETIGLLDCVGRTSAGYRFYGAYAQHQARMVVQLRRLGLTIKELKQLFDTDESRNSLRKRLVGLLDEKLRETELQLRIKQGQLDDLSARHEAVILTPSDRPGSCICDVLLTPCMCGKNIEG